MKKQLFTLLILSFSLVLAACNHAEEEPLQPLSVDAWPTPVAAQPAPLPTPFPKISLDDVLVAESAPVTGAINTDTPQETETNKAVAVAEETNNPQSQTDVAAKTSVAGALTVANLSRITDGQVTISAVNVRQGPGTNYDTLDVVQLGQVVDVLATNPKKDWVLINISNKTNRNGWVSLDYLDLFDPVDMLPVVLSSTPDKAISAEQVAQMFLVTEGQTAQMVSREEDTGTGYRPVAASYEQSASNPTTVPNLEPVATAKPVTSAKIQVRPAPNANAAPINELSDPEENITILGVDPTRQWALVNPQHDHSRVGWVSLNDLKIVNGDVSNAPEIYTAWTNSNALTIRTGPGIFHTTVGELPINNIVRVVGLNEGRSWALVQPVLGNGEGWTQIQYLTLSDKVANLPLAPAPPLVKAAEPIAPANADVSASEGKLVLQLSSGGEIKTINADGTELRNLTHGIDPALSPDGQTVAFTRWAQGETGNGSVWLVDVDGSNERQIMEFVKQPKGPEWSPDGTQLVINFQHERRVEEKPVKVEYSKGKASKIPWNASDIGVEVEPIIKNGQVAGAVPYLKYTLPPDPHWGLRVVNLTDGSFEDIDGGTYAFRPAWDPAQPWRLVSDGGQGLVEVDVNRNYQKKITEVIGDGSPVFLPDGQFVAVTVGQQGGSNGYDIYRLNRDGGSRVQLTQTPLWAAVTPEGEGKRWNNVSPAWSPDGTQIAYLTDRSGRWEVWVMNADGSNPRSMFSDEVNEALNIQYNFVDERVLNWR